MVLVNDWSARDIQRFEYIPLGPFLGKSFATSVSPWVVTLEALRPYLVPGPKQEPEPADYLRTGRDWAVDLSLEAGVRIGLGEWVGTIVPATRRSIAFGVAWNGQGVRYQMSDVRSALCAGIRI